MKQHAIAVLIAMSMLAGAPPMRAEPPAMLSEPVTLYEITAAMHRQGVESVEDFIEILPLNHRKGFHFSGWAGTTFHRNGTGEYSPLVIATGENWETVFAWQTQLEQTSVARFDKVWWIRNVRGGPRMGVIEFDGTRWEISGHGRCGSCHLDESGAVYYRSLVHPDSFMLSDEEQAAWLNSLAANPRVSPLLEGEAEPSGALEFHGQPVVRLTDFRGEEQVLTDGAAVDLDRLRGRFGLKMLVEFPGKGVSSVRIGAARAASGAELPDEESGDHPFELELRDRAWLQEGYHYAQLTPFAGDVAGEPHVIRYRMPAGLLRPPTGGSSRTSGSSRIARTGGEGWISCDTCSAKQLESLRRSVDVFCNQLQIIDGEIRFGPPGVTPVRGYSAANGFEYEAEFSCDGSP